MTVSTAPPLTELLSAVAQPAALVSAAGAILWANPALRSLFRPDPAPVSLAAWESRSPDAGEAGATWEELSRLGEAVRRLATAGGVGLFHLVLVRDRDGGGALLCHTTAARRDVRELRERTAILEAIFHSLNEGVLALDAEQRITAFSLSAERLTGFGEAEVLGRLCRDVFAAPPEVECPFETMIREDKAAYRLEMELRGKNGLRVHVAVNSTLLHDTEGKVEGAVVVLRDLTELDQLRQGIGPAPGLSAIIGSHPSIRRVIDRIETVAPSEASILILGESGTGKELVARAVHELSGRRQGPFVKVNCGALAEALLESELFGHVRGAFTGAIKDRPGRFETAHGGTLFLDEVGDTSAAFQVKLLRVLQEGEFERVGDSRTRHTDVRVVAATHRDLRRDMAEGRFRDDLFYRLCVVPIQLPTLRERRGDVPFLADHFLRRFALQEGRRKTLAAPVYGILEAYPWPGNVRELENAIAHAFVCSAGDVIEAAALPEHILTRDVAASPEESDAAQAIFAALNAAAWNKGEAARRLALSRTTLWRRMKDLGIGDRRKARLKAKR